MTIDQALNPIPINLLAQMKRIKPAGVALEIGLNIYTQQFVFSGDVNAGGLEISAPFYFGYGFGETGVGNENIGGFFTELLTNEVTI